MGVGRQQRPARGVGRRHPDADGRPGDRQRNGECPHRGRPDDQAEPGRRRQRRPGDQHPRRPAIEHRRGDPVPESGEDGRDRKEDAGHQRYLPLRDEALDVQGENRTEAAIDELEAENRHEDHPEAWRPRQLADHLAQTARRRPGLARPRLAIGGCDGDHRGQIEERRDEERRAQADQRRQHAADDGTHRRAEPLGDLHRADRFGHALARHRLGRHRHRQRAVAGEDAEQRAQGEQLPRGGDERHRRLGDDKRAQRSNHQHLAAVAVADASPQRRADGGDGRRGAERQPGPQRDVGDVGHAQLADVQRQERHHQREAGEADAVGRGRGQDIGARREVRGSGRRTHRARPVLKSECGPRVPRRPGCCR